MIKVLAPLIENPNQLTHCDCSTHHFVAPMHFAAYFGNEDALKVLATFTRNVNIVDKFGRTPLHIAAYFGWINLLKFLAPLMENPNVPDDKGKTSTDYAKQRGHDEFVRILESYIK